MTEYKLYQYEDDDYILHHTLTPCPDINSSTFKRHLHFQCEIYYFINGDGSYVCNGRLYPLQKGSLIFTPSGRPHNIILHSNAEYERVVILFNPHTLDKPISRLFSATYPADSQFFLLKEKEQTWFEECFECLENHDFDNNTSRDLFSSIINLCIAKTHIKETIPQENLIEDELVRKMVYFIHRNLDQELSLAVFEAEFYLNSSYLNRRFKRVMGYSIWEYIIISRIFTSQQDLYHLRDPKAAFKRSGFKDYSTFYRNYKKYTGVSPSEDLRAFLQE